MSDSSSTDKSNKPQYLVMFQGLVTGPYESSLDPSKHTKPVLNADALSQAQNYLNNQSAMRLATTPLGVQISTTSVQRHSKGFS